MAKPLPKSRINLRFSLVLVAVFILVSSLGLNLFLHFKKDAFTELASKDLRHILKADNIFFVFPNTIVVRNAALIPKEGPQNRESSVTVSLTAIKISLGKLLTQRQWSFPSIVLDRIQASQSSLTKLANDYGQGTVTFLQSLPLADTTFLIKEAYVYPALDDPESNSLVTNFAFYLRKDRLEAHGSITHIKTLAPLLIALTGNVTADGFRLEQLSLNKANLTSNFWGNITKGSLQLNGYAFYSPRIPRRSHSIIERLLQAFFPLKSRRISDPSIELIDIDCQAKLEYPKLTIENIKFVLNNFPVALRGTVLLSSPVSLNVAATLANAPPGPSRIKNFQQANYTLQGGFSKNAFRAQTNLNFLFGQEDGESFPLNKIDISSEKMLLYFDQNRRFTAQFNPVKVGIKTIKNQYQISFDDLKAFFNWKGDKFKIIDLVAAMYGGKLQGRVWCDVTQNPLRVTLSANFKEMTANALSEILDYFSKIHGRLSGKLEIKSHPAFLLTGQVLVENGTLQNFDFFKWMAETFAMPSLVTVPFAETRSQFWLNAQGHGLTNIEINSENVGLNGHYNLDKNGLVNSKLSLSLGRPILQESPKFRAILKMFEQDIPSLAFDFQLSGHQDAMNFQWLQSEFKQRIESRIPNFVERMIDRKIDAILEGNIPEEQPAESTQ